MDATRNLLEEFDVYSRRILYLSLFLNGIFDSLKIIDILCDEEAERIKYIRAYEDLVLYGFLYPERMINVFPGLVSELKELKNSPGSSVLERIYIRYGMINDPDPQLALCLSEIFRESGDPDRSMEFKLKAVNSLIDRGNTEIALPLIKSIKKEFKKSRLKGSGLSVYTDVMFLKAALHDSRIPLVNELVQEISAAEPGDDARVQIALSTVLSEAYYSMYEYHKSLEPAKKALLTAQQAEISGAESGINSLLGKIMLGMQRIEEAKDYFRISRETADPSNGGEQNAKTYYLEAVSYYIYGNISQSIRLLDRTIEISRGNGERRWELLALLQRGGSILILADISNPVTCFQNVLLCRGFTTGSRVLILFIPGLPVLLYTEAGDRKGKESLPGIRIQPKDYFSIRNSFTSRESINRLLMLSVNQLKLRMTVCIYFYLRILDCLTADMST